MYEYNNYFLHVKIALLHQFNSLIHNGCTYMLKIEWILQKKLKLYIEYDTYIIFF